MSFIGKYAFVTGGSRGIGKAIAIELANRGVHIAFNYFRSDSAALETQKEIEALGVRCVRIRANIADSSKLITIFERIEKEFNTLDILVNNAASGIQRSASDLTEKHWEWTMNVNAKAAWMCSIRASQLMSKGGNIINITSQGSSKVLPYYFSVGTSKAALESMTRYLAVELAPKNISVNAVSGGYVNTNALEHFPNREDMIKAGDQTLTGRPVEAQDIANTVAFLCTSDAEMIRGQVITVDGGVSLRG